MFLQLSTALEHQDEHHLQECYQLDQHNMISLHARVQQNYIHWWLHTLARHRPILHTALVQGSAHSAMLAEVSQYKPAVVLAELHFLLWYLMSQWQL